MGTKERGSTFGLVRKASRTSARNILARAKSYEFKRALEPPYPDAKFY